MEDLNDILQEVSEMADEGLHCNSDQHKRWYLYKIATKMGMDCSDLEPGVEP